MPLTPAQFRENLTRRFAATAEADEHAEREARSRLPQAVALIVEQLGPRRIVLYGSLTTGLFRAQHSDIDLAVHGLGPQAPESLTLALRRVFGRDVDLVDPELVAGFVREAIERGEVLFEPR